MECERLTKLIKSWYIQVKDEALAPARMVDFMRSHLAGCQVCRQDSVVESEVKKIIAIILPANKTPKAIREDDSEFDEGDDSPPDQPGEVDDEEEEQPGDELDDEGEDLDELEDEDDDI